MRKLSVFILGWILSFTFVVFGRYGAVLASADAPVVYIGGMSAGFTLKSGKIQVVGLCEVLTEEAVKSPALDAGIRAGDYIQTVSGTSVETVSQLNECIKASKGKRLRMQVQRGNETLTVEVQAVKDKTNNEYKIGVLTKDSVSGIGTITYIDGANGRFGALGHTVLGENNRELSMSGGIVYGCSIVGVSKGERGKAGELRGMFLSDCAVGNAEKLCKCGIFGTVSEDFALNALSQTVACSSQVIPGKAFIYSTVNGNSPKKYEIEIVKVDKNNKENKNYVIKITDDELIEQTGGIVQGMSGSPIIQNDKMVGAVTHVFLNDPTRGYGIDISEMLKN